jgi:hypothetical protein
MYSASDILLDIDVDINTGIFNIMNWSFIVNHPVMLKLTVDQALFISRLNTQQKGLL